jgi:hypothetical protein
VIVEFTWTLDDTMTAILEFTLEKAEVTVDTAIFLELENNVLITVRNRLLVLCLAWVEVLSHDDL